MKRAFKFIALLVVALLLFGCTEGTRRVFKSVTSNIAGLERVVTVYSYDGDVIAEYRGRIDLDYHDGRVLFELDGKRIAIYNAVVIAEEL